MTAMTPENHHHGVHDESSHGSTKSYIIGFILSIVLTLLAFGAVDMHWFTPIITVVFISVLAIFQLLVQLMLFLHLSSESKPYWNLTAFLFATLIVFVVVAASIWIMYNLNANMM